MKFKLLDSPISPHFPGKIITPSFGFHKNNCFIFLLAHYFFHQTDKPIVEKLLLEVGLICTVQVWFSQPVFNFFSGLTLLSKTH